MKKIHSQRLLLFCAALFLMAALSCNREDGPGEDSVSKSQPAVENDEFPVEPDDYAGFDVIPNANANSEKPTN